ncbi:MAG TPA: DUF488 domain-containing protein [Candidatus Acidoferrales bacterium]|nr:DUF488 domain-containing protein [Candidatus Acidoferrales bacterium]
MRIWTIGHSNRSIEEFIAALRANAIEQLVDVRRFPASQHNPQFAEQSVRDSLRDAGIEYRWMGKELGGRRSTSKSSPNVALRNASFRGYADYMLTSEFHGGIESLRELAAMKRTAIMCAELLWWRCHRSMISDYLTGIFSDEVTHIRDAEYSEPHKLKDIARIDGQRLIYDAGAGDALF